MGIHYDYKSTRGDKAMKKEAKRKARIEQRRARKSSASIQKRLNKKRCMTSINLSPRGFNKSRQKLIFLMKSFDQKDFF